MNFTTQYGAYTWGTSKFMYLFEPVEPIFKVGSYSIPSKKTSLLFAWKFAIFQLFLIHFLEFFLMCDRQKRRIFFKLTTAHFHICYYQKIKVNVIFDDISGFCLDICKLSTDSESSHLQIFLEVIRSNGGFFFSPHDHFVYNFTIQQNAFSSLSQLHAWKCQKCSDQLFSPI